MLQAQGKSFAGAEDFANCGGLPAAVESEEELESSTAGFRSTTDS